MRFLTSSQNRLKQANISYWSEQGCYASSPVFVQAPQAKQEDEGVLLSIVFDSTVNRSFLVILDADTMTEHLQSL